LAEKKQQDDCRLPDGSQHDGSKTRQDFIVRLPVEEHQKLKALAARNERSASGELRLVLREHIQASGAV
jgi:hypothetical protein